MAKKQSILPGRKQAARWTERLRGTFGSFTTEGPEQISYITARFDVDDLRQLRTARQVFPREILTIRELMQRDIDDDRVRRIVAEYLTPTKGRAGALFFPPLVVAVIPRGERTAGERIAKLYPKPVLEGKDFPVTFDPIDQVYYQERTYGSAFGVRIPLKEKDAPVATDAIFHGAELMWHRDRVDLMVIDGQHRLVALKAALGILEDEEEVRGYAGTALTSDESEQLGFSSISVCVIFPPELYEGGPRINAHQTLVSLFRTVFVDVNKNAKPVSESRNILLDERDLIAIFTRNIVDSLGTEEQMRSSEDIDILPLYAFEWDSPEGKERQVNDERAVCSVGLLKAHVDRVLLRNADDTDHFRSELRIEEGDQQIDPEKAEGAHSGPAPSEIEPNYFASWQRPVLEQRFKQRWEGAILYVLRALYPAKRLIAALEIQRKELTKAIKSERQFNRVAMEYLLGTRSDQALIERVAQGERERLGRYDRAICEQVVDAIGNKFLGGEMHRLRGTPLARLFFSNVGQSQMFEFAFGTLQENGGKSTSEPMTVATAFVEDFNAGFEESAVHEELFDPQREWNSTMIGTLGTQSWKQSHIGGLLLLSSKFYPNDGALSKLKWEEGSWAKQIQWYSDKGLEIVFGGLVNRYSRQLRDEPDIQMMNEDDRAQAIRHRARKKAEDVRKLLKAFLDGEPRGLRRPRRGR